MAGCRGRHRIGRRLAAGRVRYLPGREAYLDAELDAFQRGLVLPAPRGVLRPGGRPWTEETRLPAHSHRYKLHRGLLHRASVRWFHLPESHDPSQPEFLQAVWRHLRAVSPRSGGVVGLLADPLVDVSAQIVP